MEGKYSEEKLFKACYAWVKSEEMAAIFERADKIVLERQMTLKFQMINHMIRTLYFEKTVERNPTTVGAFFHFPRDRSSKKKAAITLVGLNAAFPHNKKKDDLADAYLLTIFELWDNCEFLREGWRDVIRPANSDRRPARKRRSPSVSLSTAVPQKSGSALVNTKRRLIDLTGPSTSSEDQSGEESGHFHLN